MKKIVIFNISEFIIMATILAFANASYKVTNFAGFNSGYSNGAGTSASFQSPSQMAFNSAGIMYVADTLNNRIRAISVSGEVSTFAGSGNKETVNGQGVLASFKNPKGIVFDSLGNMYVSDSEGHVVRKISPSGNVVTFAGSGIPGFMEGQGTSARFNYPHGMVIDANNNIYICDKANNRIRKITPNGNVTTIAGGSAGAADGTGASASFNSPHGITMDSTGNLYVTDSLNHVVRKITPNHVVTTFAGKLRNSAGYYDGLGNNARFSVPLGICIDKNDNLYVADNYNYRIRKISPTGDTKTIIGNDYSVITDGDANSASFRLPAEIVMNENGILFVADEHQIRKITSTCEEGYGVSSSSAGSLTCIKCGAGQFAHAGSVYCVNCGIGKYSNIGAGSCTTCPPGSYSNTIGSNTCISCLAGQYSPGGPTPCSDCGIGQYSGNGASTCTACPLGSYSSSIGSPSCVQCSVGTYLPAGSTECRPCPSGETSNTGATSCFVITTALISSTNLFPKNYTFDDKQNTSTKVPALATIISTAYEISATGIPTAEFDIQTPIASEPTITAIISDLSKTAVSTAVTTDFVTQIPTIEPIPATELSEFLNIRDSTTVTTNFDTQTPTIEPIPATELSEFLNIRDSTAVTTNFDTQASISEPSPVSEFSVTGVFTAAETQDTRTSEPITAAVSSSTEVSNVGLSSNSRISSKGFQRSETKAQSILNSMQSEIKYYSEAVTTITETEQITGNNSLSTIYSSITTSSTLLAKPTEVPAKPILSLMAGTGERGSTDGQLSVASFNYPSGLACDSNNNIFVADSQNNRIRKISPDGMVSTITNLDLSNPNGVATDSSGNLYIADTGNNRIIKITVTESLEARSGANRRAIEKRKLVYSASVLAGTGKSGFSNGDGGFATFRAPTGITVDKSGFIYVSDTGNHSVRKISPNGVVTTLAGTGSPGSVNLQGSSASFNYPHGIASDNNGNIVIADSNNHKIRKIDQQGVVTTLAGTDSDSSTEGPAINASLRYPYGITVSRTGAIYISDLYDNSISKISNDGVISTVVGGDSLSASGGYKNLTGLVINADDTLYFADSENCMIRSVTNSCPAGYYKSNETIEKDSCFICSPGTYSKEGGNECTSCPAGTFSEYGASSCHDVTSKRTIFEISTTTITIERVVGYSQNFHSDTSVISITTSTTNETTDTDRQNFAIPIGATAGLVVVAAAAASTFYFVKRRYAENTEW